MLLEQAFIFMGKQDLLSSIIFGMATLQGFILISSLIIGGKYRKLQHWFLIGLILCITLILFQNFIVLSGYYLKMPALILPFFPLNGLVAPLFFFYVLLTLYPKRGLKIYDAIHLVTFFYLQYNHIGFLTLADEYKIGAAEYWYFSDVHYGTLVTPGMILRKVMVFGYGICALLYLQRKMVTLQHHAANTDLTFLRKFRWVVYAFILYAISSTMLKIYSYVNDIYVGNYEIYHHIINSLVILALTLLAMNQPKILTSLLKESSGKPNNKREGVSENVLIHLEQFMQKNKPYLNPDLKLIDLARLAQLSPSSISSAINNELEVNFFEYVNQYRVKEFKERIDSEKYAHYTLLGIGLDVGFNSKASMNRIFKKHTGVTPSQYSKKNNVSTYELETQLR